jgi:hypothetical protein
MNRPEFISILFMIFLQVAGGIWWASKLQTRQEMHSEVIARFQVQIEEYPVTKNRVLHLEANVDKLILKLDDLVTALKGGAQNGK